MGFLDTFRDGTNLKLRQLDKISDTFLMVCPFLEKLPRGVNVGSYHSVQLTTSVFGMVSLRKTRQNTATKGELDRRLRSI